MDDLKKNIEENRKWQQERSSWSENYVVALNKTQTDLALKQAIINNITQWTVKFIAETHMILTLQQDIHQLEWITNTNSSPSKSLLHF